MKVYSIKKEKILIVLYIFMLGVVVWVDYAQRRWVCVAIPDLTASLGSVTDA
jgi:hypothetical protein